MHPDRRRKGRLPVAHLSVVEYEVPTSSGQYPLQHHPQYGHQGNGTSRGGHDSDSSMYGDRMMEKGVDTGQYSSNERIGTSVVDGDDAMEIDHPHLPPATTLLKPPHATSVAVVNDVVPMVFRWEHGGRNVYITGTFNGWPIQCPMHRSGNDFTYIASLTRGKHAYKFVVDEEWRFAPDQLMVADVEGNVNNFVDVSEFTPLSDFDFAENRDSDASLYGRFIPDIDEYTKEPPPLPGIEDAVGEVDITPWRYPQHHSSLVQW